MYHVGLAELDPLDDEERTEYPDDALDDVEEDMDEDGDDDRMGQPPGSDLDDPRDDDW